MNRLRRFLDSMRGRLFFLLLFGMLAAAVVSTMLANAKRRQDLEQANLTRSVDRLQGYVEQLENGNTDLRARLLELGGPGVRPTDQLTTGGAADDAFADLLRARGGTLATARVTRGEARDCLPVLPGGASRGAISERIRQRREAEPPHVCRIVSLTLPDRTPLRLALDTPPVSPDRLAPLDPVFIGLLALAIAALAYAVARTAGRPLQRLAQAARALGQNLQGDPIPVAGPTEVKEAAAAFNAMQERLQRHVRERMQMLAAITHDLQTPLTRLRLRLENVEDEALRLQLVGDLAAMQALIREGLELARSAESAEQPVPLDLDSLLESLVADAAEAGADARFEHGCGAVLRVRPLAMQRVFANLIGNALAYGHSVRVASERDADGTMRVHVRDDGPGVPDDQLLAVLDPFVRLETSRSRDTGGTGLGLAIARTLAERDGATLRLLNRPEGGLDAIVEWTDPPPV